jgi:hypothetical protein
LSNMRIKYIIFAVLGAAGVLFGAWNWMNYLKQSSPAPQVQAIRPPPNPQIAALEQQAASTPPAEQKPQTEQSALPGDKMQFPDTLGRNPFLSPEEIRLIASGELIDEAPPPVVETGPLPVLKISALLKDNVSGDFVVLIGGRTYRQGEMIGTEELLEISDSSVVLQTQSGRRRTLSIGARQTDRGVTIKMRKN